MGDMTSTILMLVLMGAAFYFMLIRPQQKRAKQQQEMTNALQPGSRVMLSSGVLGTIRHLGERQAIIEIAPGVEMTVVKAAIVKTLTAEDDEFEYADDTIEPALHDDSAPLAAGYDQPATDFQRPIGQDVADDGFPSSPAGQSPEGPRPSSDPTK